MGEIIRFRFSDVFEEKTDGTLAPRRQISIGGIQFGAGVSFSPGVEFAGIDFSKFRTFDIAGRDQNGTLEIVGFFPK